MGMRLTLDKQGEYVELVVRLRDVIGHKLADDLLSTDQPSRGHRSARALVEQLKRRFRNDDAPEVRDLYSLADKLVKKSVWIVGGDAGHTTSVMAVWITSWRPAKC